MTQEFDKQELPKKVLIIDDDPTYVQQLRDLLTKYGIAVAHAADFGSVMYQFNNQYFEVAIISYEFKGENPLTIAQRLVTHEDPLRSAVSVLIASITENRPKGEDFLAREIGDIEFVVKNLNPTQILTPLSKCVQNRLLQIQNNETEDKVLDYFKSSGNLDKSVKMLKTFLPNMGGKGQEILLELYSQASKHEEAYQITQELLASIPEENLNGSHLRLVNIQGTILLQMKRFEEAKAAFELADRLAPQNLERSWEMAMLYLEMNLPEEAVQKLKTTIAAYPDKPDKKYEAFEKVIDAGFDKHGQQFCKELVSTKEIIKHYNNMGVLKSKDGHIQEAIDKYKYALRFLPKHPETYKICFNIALAYLHQTNNKEGRKFAIQYLSESLQLNPKYTKAKVLLDKLLG